MSEKCGVQVVRPLCRNVSDFILHCHNKQHAMFITLQDDYDLEYGLCR